MTGPKVPGSPRECRRSVADNDTDIHTRGAGPMSGHLLSEARRDRQPWGLWLVARWIWRALRTPFSRLSRWWRLLRIRHSGVDRTWWWHDRVWLQLVKLFTAFLALIFLAWLARALIVLIDRSPDANQFPYGFSSDRLCKGRSVECGALTGWVTSLLSIALASAVFLLWRLGRLRRHYLRTARRRPRELVPTAGTIIGKIVGRDQLCRVIMEDLRVRRTRRPHVLVGGVGTGKTAVLVQLTELLAKRHAVPVPIRLREAEKLDFTALAKDRFLEEMDERLTSTAEGEKAWRRMLRDGRIVVLADGLEEALSDEKAEESGDRDTEIRKAIRKAHKRQLPLFIASRPHAPLRGMDATIHELEPLSEVDAFSYITENTPSEDDWRLSWIVEMADVAEVPLYLQITHELSRLDMLDRIVAREDQVLRTRTHDQSTLRLRLLQAWEEALVRGRLYPEVPLDRAERELTLDWISALACTGLKNDSIEVGLDEPLSDGFHQLLTQPPDPATPVRPGRRGLSGIDQRLAATWAAQLGLVELRARKIRFEHSLIEAYLGSRLMDTALTEEYWRGALHGDSAAGNGAERPGPGREFLIALVLHSRYGAGQSPLTARSASRRQQRRISTQEVCARLMAAADGRYDNKALDIYAAAAEIAGAPGRPDATRVPAHASLVAARVEQSRRIAIHGTELGLNARPGHDLRGDPMESASLPDIARRVKKQWPQIRCADLRTLEEAKIGLLRRFGLTLRMQDEASRGHGSDLGYAQLCDICCQEDSFRVRLAGAHEIGQGGCAAYQELRDRLAVPGKNWPAVKPADGRQPGEQPDNLQHTWTRQVSAWLVPLLVTSADPNCDDPEMEETRRDVREDLKRWVEHVGPAPQDCSEHKDRLKIPEEIALAQGLKYAANRRHGYVHTRPDAWPYLENQAQKMLKHARHWFSELTLIQALTLWALPEGNEPLPASQDGEESSTPRRPRQNPDRTVERWLDIIADKPRDHDGGKTRPVHPFVEAAADLASRALAVQQPGRFLWMAQSDAVSRVGAGQPKQAPPSARKSPVWIPPSQGWSALDPEAQQLLADVLLLFNLVERGDIPQETEDRLEQASKNELPPCITRDRRPLEPLLTVGTAESHQQGSSCLDGCRFQLCPYPPKGLQHHRTELSEEFCRRQDRLVSRYMKPRRHTARWQGMSAGRLRVFWSQMAERARNSSG